MSSSKPPSFDFTTTYYFSLLLDFLTFAIFIFLFRSFYCCRLLRILQMLSLISLLYLSLCSFSIDLVFDSMSLRNSGRLLFLEWMEECSTWWCSRLAVCWVRSSLKFILLLCSLVLVSRVRLWSSCLCFWAAVSLSIPFWEATRLLVATLTIFYASLMLASL